MPEEKDKIKKLYDTFVSDGYDMESEEDFRKNLLDSTKRKAAYDALVKDGYDMEPFEEFESNIGFGKERTSSQQSGNSASGTVEEPISPANEQTWQPTEKEKVAMLTETDRIMNDVKSHTQTFNERIDNMQEYGINPGLQTKEGKMIFNPESGKLERTFLTPAGNRYYSKSLADMESFQYRQAADMSIGGQLRKANLRLQELKAKQAERASEVHKEWAEETENNKAPLAAILGAATYTPRQQSDKENHALSVAIRETEELIKNLEEQKDRENGVDVGFWRGFGRTMGDVRTWDFGMGDMRDAFTMMNADELKKENATEGEREAHDAMMGAIHEKQQAEERYSGNADFWNRAGVMTGYMPSFMLDFVLTGGGFNGLSSFSKGSTKLATKVISKETAEKMAQQGFKSYIKENGAKGLGRYASDWTIKALGTTADDLLVRAPLMANTVQAGKTTADIIDRKLGDVVVDENGNYDFSNDKTWGDAIWQSEANAIIENYSEMFGAHLDPVFTLGNMSKLANVLGAKRIGAVLSKADASALNGIMGQTHQMFNKMGVSDYVGEVSEEYYGQLWRTMLNLDDAYQQNPDGTRTNLFASGQFHGDIWGGMALSMGLMGAGKHTLSAANYTSMKHGVNKADAKVNELLGKEVWEPLKATLDLTTNENIGEVAELIAGDKDFTINEKAAVLDYMERSLNLRGFNLASMAQSRGGNRNESVQQANDSYLDGYNIISSQEMNDAKNMYEYQRARVADLVDESMFAMIEENPIAALEFVNGNEQWNDEDKVSVIDYINAKQVYNGMIQRVRDDIDGRIEQSNSMIDARVNHNTGMIQGATMKQDERKVYVISGKLVPYDDGSGVSVTDSDNSIIIRDSETGALEQVSPDTVLSLDESQDPNEQKELAEQAIVEQFAREAADKIDGKVTFNSGDAYTITGQDGSQMQVQVIANEDGIVDNGDGTVNVSDGVNIFPLAKETIQQQADAANLARVAQFEQQRTIENAERKQEMQEAERPQYALNDIVSLTDENGVTVRGNITADADADGKYEVFTEAPINGKRVNLFTRDELDNMLLEHNGVAFEHPAENESNNGAENIPENDNNAPQNIPAMQRIPKDEQGDPLYEQADSDTAWDAIVEQTEGDEDMAQTVADGMVADKEEALKKLEKAKSKGGNSIAEKIASEKERKAAIDAAKQELLVWQKIAGTAKRRKMEADDERRRIADEAAALRKAEEEKLRAEREEAERIEREALNGVPDMVDDKPQDARARGYRRMNGHKIDRQEPVQALQGKEVSVKFSDDAIVGGRVAVIDVNLLQPSHIQGVRNPLHFIDEAQPKERNDEASVLSARKIAGDIRPEEITSSVTAYTGAPTVNARGEAIQGNNRSDALRIMWENHPEQAALYKQYLKDHAEEFGLQAEDIEAMEHPVLVNMVDVDDAEAIRLGQYVAQDTESGGVERIKPKNALQRMGAEMRSFANLLLRTSDDEMSFAGLVDSNGANVLKWMSQRGFITPTQYKSAFDSKGNLTPESKNDLRGIMYQSIFKDGSTRLEEMFNVLPVKAQKAILANAVAVAEKETDTTPTEKQKEAGNYKKGHVQVGTFNITIENPKGSVRSGIDTEGNKWETTMQNTYGYIRGTEGVDGDHIDVFLSDDIDGWNGRRVFVVDQYNEDGSFDEHKVMLGFNETDDAEAAYFANYDSDWANNHKTVVTAVNLENFEKWIDSSHRKTKAFAEYKSVKSVEEQSSGTQVDRLSEIKSRIEELHKEQEAAHGQSDIFEEARIISEINDLFAGQRKLEQSNSNEETTTPTDAAYTITPAQYTTKRGKVLDMHLVKFNNELRDTVRKHTTMFAKQLKGWWNKEKQGFMMRSKEDAERLAEYATDAQSQPPLSLSDLSEVNDGNVQFAESQLLETSKQEEKQEYSPVWQYSVSVDKKTGLTTLKRDDVSGPIPIGDGRFNYTANSPEEMLEIVRNPKNFNQELRDAVETILENKVKIREIVRTEKAEATEQESKPENNPSGNRLVTDERYAELRERMRKKLLGQMNMGIDPEILAIGTEMAVYHLEKGARKFTEYATAMVADLGDSIRPYLKAFYNGARDLPEVAENGLDADMTPYDEVQQFDVTNFDKKSIDALATAETVTRETEVEQEAEIAQERIKKSRPARKKNEKKAVISQQSNELGLFDALTDNNKNSEHGLQRTDAERSERVPAKGYRHEQGLSRGTETGSESEQQAGRGTDNEGERTGDAVDRTVRPRLSDSLNEQSIEGKRKKEIEKNRKLADELKGVTLHLNDKLGGEHEISGIVYYELANVFHCNDNISGPFQAIRKELDAILKVARKNDGRNTFTPKNTHNNHSERGKDHAPTSVDARIEANIKAIELAKQLLESGEQATEKQMQTLRKFSGWGGLGKAFNEGTSYASNPIAKKLRELLGEKAYQEAIMSANSAYYTPAYVVDTLWDIAEQMGFNGGNILEGSAGIGNILGQMPTNISERSDIHAIEIDRTSGGILSLLYPDAKVEIQGFEQTRIPNGSVDLAITNVPFVTGLRVNDTTGDKDLSKKFHNIHDFCIAKNVRKLREGGLGIFITSNGTLDNSKKLRDWIVNEGGSDFVGAFRMHNKTFGGTGVTSDIVVIRKRVNGQKSAHVIDVSDVSGERMAEYDTGETRKVKGKETPVIKQLSMDYNRYFIEHPENMAGEMHFAFEKGDTFRPTSKGLYPAQDKKQEQMLSKFVHSFKAEEFGERNAGPVTDVMPDKKIGEIFIRDGKLFINSTASAQPLEVNANKVKGHTKVECFEAYTAIKEALAEVLSYQTENESDEGLKPLLDKLNKAYDDFVGTYGHFNKNTAIAFLRNDVDYANVFALEKFEETADEKGNRIQKFEKTDVFSKRVVEKDKEPTPANVKDGIIASIFKFGRVDIPYIAEQLGTGIENVKKEIIESGYGFEDPVSRQMEASYQYLSGNIREKLRQAEENNENGEFDRNIKALQEVMPMEIPAHLIDFTLGSSWIDPKLYEDFVKERTEVDVRFTAVGGTWFMKEPYFTNYEKNRAMGVTSEMLGRTIMGHTLIEAAIQNRSITVSTTKKHYDGTTETITDKEATQACAAKIDEIRQDFKDWARQKMQSDPEMSERMERIYNDMFNNFVPMSIPDEFVPEYFGGASHKFKMRPHQGRAIVRGTQQPLLLAHEVGTGKTFTLISTAMEMRRLGTARKPMIVVQNATVGQFVASAKELYPNAKILTLEEADRSAEGRKNFYAKIRYNDWDMIVVPQSTFEFIPDSEEREMTFVQDKIEEKMLILEQMKEEDPDGKNMITRQAEREIELLEEQLAGLADNASKKRTANDEKKRAVALQNAEVKAMEMLDRRTDDVENFDDMGIDALLVDEAHEYKHLGFATAMQRGVKGVDPSYSKKSQGVFLKTQTVLEKNNGRNVIFATGTPISNTAAEIWTFMRYLMPADTMKEYGIYYFDDFVRNFGNIQQMLEFTTSGKFKENNRFAGYVNLPELVRIWSGVSDTVLTKEAGGVKDKIPEMEGGKAQDLYLPQTRALRSIMKFVKSELEHYEQMSGKEKKENSHIPLTMYGIAKAAAVDARLVQSDAEDDQNSKTNEAVRQTLRSLKETADYKGTVAIFADNYQNKQSGFNLYDDIRNKLIAEGVPADEIVVMRSGMTVKKKLEIFEKVNRGEVRVILGSTFTLGTGVNIQERLHTLIHLDAPNRPMDYTQRNGRILRQGNLHKDMNKPVRILRFGVEDSLDVTAYQRLKTKGAIADSIMNGKQMMNNSMTNRVLEEEEDVFGDTVAQLSGSEYAMLKNNAEKNVRKYASRKKQWETDQTYIHNAKPRLKAFIKDAEKRIEDNGRYLEAVRSLFPDGQFKEIVTGKHRFASVDTMDDFFKEHNKSILAEMKQMKDGEISGEQKRELIIQIGDFSFVVTTKLTRKTMSDGATLFNDVERRMTYSCLELGIVDVPVRQNLLRNAIENITDNVITGKDFAERLSAGERSKKHNEAELEELLSREGKPFEYEEELAQAKAQLEEYAELMKKELEEKEAKYAEMDASVETANDITNTDEDDVLYRSDDTMYRIREDAAPQNTGIGYKVFVLKNGELYPPMVANPNGEATPVGVWLDADAAPIAGQSKTGRNQVKAGGKGTQGGSGKLAYRPGWHLGVIPYALQFNRIDENGDKTLFPANFVWAEVEYANDVDYQEEAMSYGYNKNGKFQHSYAGLPRIPENGAYTYRTNPNPETDPWIITGAMRVKRLLTPSEVDEMVKEAGREPQRRQENAVTDAEIAALNAEIANDYRNGIGTYTDDEVSYENDPVAKLLGQSRRTAKQRREFAQRERQRMAERVESLAEKLHLDNVEVVTDASVLDGKKQRAKGFYSKSTGKITIVIPNHTSTFDVEQTLLHEAVAHYGLRQLFGEHFDTFLDNVFNNADENIRRRIVDMAAKNGWDFHKATEEYLASLAEDTEFENINASWWQQIKDFFLNMLHKIGFEDFRGVTLSDNELRYILWRSYENLAEPGRYRNILGEAADVAKQYELKVGNYAVSDPHHQTVAESDDALYRTGDPEIHERELARDRYERRVKSGMFQSQEALQDSMLGLKEAMTAILGKETNIEDVDGFENAYLGENRLSSVNKAEADAFAHTLFKPMLDEVAKLARTEAEREELTDYMMAKHGLERNTYMRNEAINNGATDADQTDYAGLTSLTGMDNVTDAETEAQIMVNDYEQAHDTTDLWKKVNAASKAILSKSYECGMMSKATFDKISDMYDFYIPLRGFDEKTSSEAYAYLTHKQSAFNAPIKKAEGRRSKADDPFANLQSMAEGAIMQGNRNKLVKQRFLNFALNHSSDLVSVSDIWVEYDTVADEWKPVFPDNIDSTDTPEVVERKMLDFETKMESLAQQYPDRYKHGKDTVNIPYRIVESRDMRQHQIVVKRGGRDYVITINGNPRAAQALNGQTNPDNDMSGAIGAILRAGENINRQLSAFYTTRNPDFIVSNFMRDMLYTNTMTWIRESPNYALRFHRNYMYANPVRIKQLLAKHRKGTLDMSNKTEAMFHQFMMNGGETGYANIRDIEQHKNDIRRELKKSNGKIPVKKAWDLLGERFDEYNRAVENCARFAAFMTSREMGRSIDRAIYDAKEISVNFNKKGSGAKFYNSTGQTKAGNASALVSGLGRSGYVFWNAAIQGTANFGRQMKRHPAKAFTGIAAMFLLGAIVAYLGGDDDDDDDKNAYYNLPEYVRRSNILFRAGNSWVSIPLPVEYRAVYGMGELMISVLNGKEHLTGEEIAEAITGQATQILPIDFLEGGGGLNAFVPSAYKPLWEAYVAEKSWTGMPLYKDTPYNKDMPEWTKAYKSANKYIVGLANAMNEATGGDPYTKGTIDFNPAKIEYMLNGYFGGVFGTIDKLSKTAETITDNREYDPRSFLLVNRLVKAGDERTEYRAVNNEYFRLKEEHDRLKSRLKHYEEDTDNDIFDYAEKIDFLYNSPEYERYEIFEDYRRDIDDLYNELNDTVDDEERKNIEAELNELKKEMIEEMNKTRK